jgi:poly(A) polymerase
MLIVRALENTDARIAEGKPVTPAFLFAALLWEPLRRAEAAYREADEPPPRALDLAADDVLREQSRAVAFPRRFALVTRDIWSLQPRLTQTSGRRPSRLIEQPRFRAGYDFLVLRAAAGEDVQSLADWWTAFQEADVSERERLLKPPAGARARRRPRRRRGRRAEAPAETPDATPAE